MNTGLLIEVWSKGVFWDRALGYHWVQLQEVSYASEVSLFMAVLRCAALCCAVLWFLQAAEERSDGPTTWRISLLFGAASRRGTWSRLTPKIVYSQQSILLWGIRFWKDMRMLALKVWKKTGPAARSMPWKAQSYRKISFAKVVLSVKKKTSFGRARPISFGGCLSV